MTKLTDLLVALGDDNIGLQNLDQCGEQIDWSAKKGTKITFVTDQPIVQSEAGGWGTDKMGLVIWVDRAQVAAFMVGQGK